MKPAAPVATVDAQNPWLGLVSFTEETRGYFHGRDEEVAELGRRVQRKLLTVLFGQSGLGKTSILQAGLVPRLRPEGFCPVYVRIDYDPGSPSPSEQIKQAVFRSTGAVGSWTQSGSAVEGETLWEFLHHRDDVLKDATGRALIPILIFDQFEEIFTLAQSDDAGRRRAHEFLADLADLVENRPPAALEARIDRDEADAARFDFARADYRILISLREDYLAHLEGLKGQMPSVTQNRMRLARMTGAQAVAAVRAPAPDLVSEAVAEAIVRFVAGGADLAHAEVEPSLLSLICRELNNARLSAGHAEISADLLAGSRDTILSEFYGRALADQPPGVRIFIEDEMLTDSGFRESIAEERVVKGFAAAGAGPGALAALVDRRLLRVEDRLDLRRVEITHDVLCGVIGASRGVRHEREALEESKRQLAAQREREAATHRALVRARAIAAVAIALMLVAAGSAVFGWINLRRAREAEVQIIAARLLAEEARGQSEKLVGFLLEDFYEELEPTGRVEIVGKLADKAVAYYEALPPELVTSQTRRYQGMALVRKAIVLGESGDYSGGTTAANEAARIFEKLRAQGDRSEDATLGLSLAYYARCIGIARLNKEDLTASADLLRPLVASGHASRSVKLALAESLNLLGLTLGADDGGIAPLMESRAILEGLGALDLSDLVAASRYGDVTDTQCRLELDLGNLKEAGRLAQIVGDMTEKVLARRPGDLQAMKNRFYSADDLAQVDDLKEDLAGADAAYRRAVDVSQRYALFNPADSQGWQYWGNSINNVGLTLMEEGRVSEALEVFRGATAMERDSRNSTGVPTPVYYGWKYLSMVEGQLGHVQAAKDAVAGARRIDALLHKQLDEDEGLRKSTEIGDDYNEFEYLASQGDFKAVHSLALALQDRIAAIPAKNPLTAAVLLSAKRGTRIWLLESDLRLGLYKDAEALARDAINQPLFGKMTRVNSADLLSRSKLLLGRSLVAQDRRAEALGSLGEAEVHYRSRLANGASDTYFRQDFAGTLYQLARAQNDDEAGRARRRALLDEAAGVLEGLTAEAKELRLSKELIQWVAEARSFAGG